MIIPMPNEEKQGLSERLVPASIAFAVTAFALSQVADPQGYSLVCLLIFAIATAVSFELHAILAQLGIGSVSRFSTWAACALPAFCVWQSEGSTLGWVLSCLVALVWPIAKSASRMEPVNRWLGILFSFFYVGLPLGLLQMNMLPATAQAAYEMKIRILLFIVAIKGMDLGGYFVGRSFGKRRLAPLLSPKKTWEGFIGGVTLSAILVAFIAWLSFGFNVEKIFYTSVAGVCLAICAQASDLFESYLKRLARIKDSGRLPGVGGMLDMVDSVLPSIYVFFALHSLGLF